jgi:hypothetical protein
VLVTTTDVCFCCQPCLVFTTQIINVLESTTIVIFVGLAGAYCSHVIVLSAQTLRKIVIVNTINLCRSCSYPVHGPVTGTLNLQLSHMYKCFTYFSTYYMVAIIQTHIAFCCGRGPLVGTQSFLELAVQML